MRATIFVSTLAGFRATAQVSNRHRIPTEVNKLNLKKIVEMLIQGADTETYSLMGHETNTPLEPPSPI